MVYEFSGFGLMVGCYVAGLVWVGVFGFGLGWLA